MHLGTALLIIALIYALVCSVRFQRALAKLIFTLGAILGFFYSFVPSLGHFTWQYLGVFSLSSGLFFAKLG